MSRRRGRGGRRGSAALLAAAALSAWCSPARPDYTLLFLARSPAARAGTLSALSWAPDPDHSRIVAFDSQLRLTKSLTGPALSRPVAVAALEGGHRLLVTEETGEGVVLDTAGREVREWASPDYASLYAASRTRIVAVRSPYRVPALSAEAAGAPLIRILDTLGVPLEGWGVARVPDLALLTSMVNAGAVAVDEDGSVYFAPLMRDEIQKYGPGGALRWTARRGLFARETDPEFLPSRGKELEVRKALVNVALALGPGGRLYALGGDDSAATRLRVDVLDTATGAILATRHLGPRETAVAVDRTGTLVALDGAALLAGAGASREREPFAPAFALPDLRGDTVTLDRFAGRVTLVNFWASWCDPCREEFPHMAELYREFDRRDFDIAAISDDVDRRKMIAFVREYRPPFPILAGGGRMKATYRYRGLPYSVLLDRHGRIIQRIFGFGGAEEFRKLRRTIAEEVRAP